MQFDEGGALWIELCPDLSEAIVHVCIEETLVLNLRRVIAIENNGDEYFQEDQVDYKHVADEIA